MAFKNILDGRKCGVRDYSHVNAAPEAAALVRAFAGEYNLYYTEAVSYLLVVGISQHEGWLLDEEETLKYLPKPLISRVRNQLHSSEKATRQAVEGVLAYGCLPEDVIVSAAVGCSRS